MKPHFIPTIAGALAVTCDLCGAAPGHPCLRWGVLGDIRQSPHEERDELARRSRAALAAHEPQEPQP